MTVGPLLSIYTTLHTSGLSHSALLYLPRAAHGSHEGIKADIPSTQHRHHLLATQWRRVPKPLPRPPRLSQALDQPCHGQSSRALDDEVLGLRHPFHGLTHLSLAHHHMVVDDIAAVHERHAVVLDSPSHTVTQRGLLVDLICGQCPPSFETLIHDARVGGVARDDQAMGLEGLMAVPTPDTIPPPPTERNTAATFWTALSSMPIVPWPAITCMSL
mmetsp:Transcript_15101/g.43303  ORF Transcript_15101/g.43303 Transcript_15101/m.43303 type:complete len:216 (-) Transcript_15101:435-1082(-)